MIAITRKDIYSYSNAKRLYAPKGVKVDAEEYGRSNSNERLFLCAYKGVKFITKDSNLKIL